jgi:hypothetical protein
MTRIQALNDLKTVVSEVKKGRRFITLNGDYEVYHAKKVCFDLGCSTTEVNNAMQEAVAEGNCPQAEPRS